MRTVTLDRKDAARAARRLVVTGCAEAATGPECADFAAVLTSELVTNAVTHGSGDVTFGFLADRMCVRVEVGDDAPELPRTYVVDDDDEGGRGMQIVEALSSEWGVRARPP